MDGKREPIAQDRIIIPMALYNRKGAWLARTLDMKHHHVSKIIHCTQGATAEQIEAIERAITGFPEAAGES